MKTVFVYDNMNVLHAAISAGTMAPHLLYGGYHMLHEGAAELCDIRKSGRIRDSNVVIISPMHALRMNRRNNRVFFININSYSSWICNGEVKRGNLISTYKKVELSSTVSFS